MKCANCGTELEEGTKFCGNCGNPVENISLENEPAVEESVSFTNEVSNDPHAERQEIVNEQLPFDTKEFKDEQAKSKKNSKAVKWILIILGVLVVVAALVFAYFKFFTKESYEKSVDSMEKAVNNLVKKENASGTIKAKVSASIDMGEEPFNMDISATVKYAKNDDKYVVYAGVDKTIFTDKMEAYMELSEKSGTLYAQGSLFGTILGVDLDDDSANAWYKFSMDFDDMGLDFSELEDSNEEIDLSELLTKDNFKYVDRKNGLKHYEYTISEEDLKDLTGDLTDELNTDLLDLDLSGMNFKIDFYLTTKNELRKIEIDFKEMLKEQLKDSGVKKLLLTVEFIDMNSTKVEIPANIKLDSIDLTTFGGSISNDADYDAEDIYYDIMLSSSIETCSTTGFEVDFKNYKDELALENDEYDVKRIQSGKIKFSVPSSGIDCVVEVVEPIVIDGKTCVKDTTSFSEYAGTCK